MRDLPITDVIEALRSACQNNKGLGQASAGVLGLRVPEIPVNATTANRWTDWEFEVASFLKRQGFELLSFDRRTHIVSVRLE